MYECKICGKECKTIQGLLSHKRLKHGIVKERKLATEELIVQPEEVYYEDPQETHLRVEKESLEREKRELQNRLMQYEDPPEIKRLRSEIEDIRERVYHSNEEKGINEESGETSEMSPPAFPPLPLLPILPPPFAETLSEKIKKLSERTLFR